MKQSMMIIYYTKRFLSGCLKGLEVPCSLHFDPARLNEIAGKFHKGARGKDVITNHRWVIIDASFQNYTR